MVFAVPLEDNFLQVSLTDDLSCIFKNVSQSPEAEILLTPNLLEFQPVLLQSEDELIVDDFYTFTKSVILFFSVCFDFLDIFF